MNKSTRDNRSTVIKHLIKEVYPDARVKVKIDKYSMGESINIWTDLMNEVYVNRSDTEMELRSILTGYESIDRDDFGDILSGGNTYMFIGGLDRVE